MQNVTDAFHTKGQAAAEKFTKAISAANKKGSLDHQAPEFCHRMTHLTPYLL
jgi:hypothetical protein